MSLNRLVNNHSLTANDGGEAISINSFKTNTMNRSRWDRFLGMTAPMTQVPVTTASKISW